MNIKLVILLFAMTFHSWSCSNLLKCEYDNTSTCMSAENWSKVNERNISMSLPNNMKKEAYTPEDSFAFRYSNDIMTVFVETGVYAQSLSSFKNDKNIIKFEEKKVETVNNRRDQANFQFAKGKTNFEDPNKEFGKVVKINCKLENDSVTFLILFSDPKLDETAEKIIESISVKCPNDIDIKH